MAEEAARNAKSVPLLTAREVASQLGVSSETVLRATRSGTLPGSRLPGGALRYRPDEFDAWLSSRSTTTHTQAMQAGRTRTVRCASYLPDPRGR
jgi:excisionase family DNA binding protein